MDVRKVEEAGNQVFEVDLHSVVVWAIRQQRLHQLDCKEVEINIKLDGRALGGNVTLVTLLQSLTFRDTLISRIPPLLLFLFIHN